MGEVNLGEQPRAAVLTVSDRSHRGEREDKSGGVVGELLGEMDIRVVVMEVVPDEEDAIAAKLRKYCDEDGMDLVVTTGGTGLDPRDVTPEATLQVMDREIPGMAEAMRAESLKVTPHAMISRAICGMRGATIMINLPGSPKAAKECLEVVRPALPHALEVAAGRVVECAPTDD